MKKPFNPFVPFYLKDFHKQSQGTLFHECKVKFDGRVYVYGIFDAKYKQRVDRDLESVTFLYIGQTGQIHQRAYTHRYRIANKTHHNKYLLYKASKIGLDNLMMVALEEVDMSNLFFPEYGQVIGQREQFYQDKFLNIQYA